MTMLKGLAPGARVTVRDEDWVIRRVDPSDDGGYLLVCDGLSELVRGTTSLFLTKLESGIKLHRPELTELYEDKSPGFSSTLLYLEAQRLRVVPNDGVIRRGHLAVMNTAPYQLVPAQKGLSHIRTRILIADGVGLGKTLEAAILATELDVRGRGRRILVITQKSMLTQFQKEWWSRFTIPLVRLDSQGIQRVRSRIPAGHNPFNYYDKTIISMDTLKGRDEYRTYLDKSRWDIIVIDECHNVASRSGNSDRAALAKQLATRSDTLILLSATPHDGSARSFASLVWLMDPTAISDPDDYTREDLDRQELFVRRFKKDIKGQSGGQFLEPQTFRHVCDASPAEERAYEALLAIPFTQAGEYRSGKGAALQRVGMQKALFSSPAAAIVATANRIRKIDKPGATADELAEIEALRTFEQALADIGTEGFSKYQLFSQTLTSLELNWNPAEPTDRLVVFSERIETLKWLQARLQKDLKLSADQIQVLDGSLPDTDQQAIVERFGKRQSPVRVLLCSDVASEGLNLHYCSHRLFHFDLPWSLMVFQQRNGRVDRFGQLVTPELRYLITRAKTEKIAGDLRILEVLQVKDEQITKNIGDPASFLRKYDAGKESEAIADAMADSVDARVFEAQLDANAAAATSTGDGDDDWLETFFGESADESNQTAVEVPRPPHSFFGSWYGYAKAALNAIGGLEAVTFDDTSESVTVTPPQDLKRRLRQTLPSEVLRQNDQYVLSAQPVVVEEAIKRAREEDQTGDAWPSVQYLWPQHPIFDWMVDHVIGQIGRQRAPVIVSPALAKDERAYLMVGLIPNRKGQPLIAEWKAVTQRAKSDPVLEDFVAFSRRAGLAAGKMINRAGGVPIDQLKDELGNVVAQMQLFVEDEVRRIGREKRELIEKKIASLKELQDRQLAQLEMRFLNTPEALHAARKARRQRDIERVFDEYRQWVRETLDVEPVPYVQVLAVVTG